MNSTPPPIPPASHASPGDGPFATLFAKISLGAPFVALGIIFLLGLLERTLPGPIIPLVRDGFVLVGTIVSLTLGVAALALMRPGERGRVVSSAAIGMVVSGLLLSIFIPNFVRAREKALAQQSNEQDFRAAVTNAAAQALKSAREGRPVDLTPFKQSVDKIARDSSGEDAALLKAGSAEVQKLQSLQAAYTGIRTELLAAKVLSTSSLTERAQIQTRKALIQKFIDANAALETHIKNREQDFHAELVREHVPEGTIADAMTGFRTASGAQTPILLEIREADRQFGETSLAILDLLDASWGNWRYDAVRGKLTFTDNTTMLAYNSKLEQVHTLERDQAAAQQRLMLLVTQYAKGQLPGAH